MTEIVVCCASDVDVYVFGIKKASIPISKSLLFLDCGYMVFSVEL